MKTTKFRVLRDALMAGPERARLVAEAERRLAAEQAAYEQSLAETRAVSAEADGCVTPRADECVPRDACAERDRDAN